MSYCTVCGSKQGHGSFCEHCGASLVSGTDRAMASKTPKKNIRVIIISAIAILLAVSMGLTYALASRSSVKDLFWDALSQAGREMFKPFQEIFGANPELAKRKASEPYRRRTAITGKADGLPAVIEDATLTLGIDADPKQELGLYSAALQLKGAEILKFELFNAPAQIALRAPFWRDEYFYLERNKIGEFVSGLIPEFPNQLSIADVTNILKLPGKAVLKSYGDVIKAELKSDQFSKEEEHYQGKKCRKITLTLSEEEIKALVVTLLQHAAEDEELLGYFGTLFPQDGYPFAAEVTPEAVIKALFASLQKLVKEQLTFPGGLHWELIIDGGNAILSNQATLGILGATLVYESSTKEEGGTQQINRLLTLREKNTKLSLAWKSSVAPDRIMTQLEVQDGQGSFLTVDLDTVITGAARKTEFYCLLKGDESAERSGVRGALTYTLDQNLGRNYSNSELILDIRVLSQNEREGKKEDWGRLNINSALEFRTDLAFPVLDPATAIDLSGLSKEELEQVAEALLSRLESILDW